MNDTFKISDIARLNESCISSSDKLDYINYLDTSNLTKNKIVEIKKIRNKFPSRAKRIVKEQTILYSTVRPNQEHYGIISNTNVKNLIVSTGFTTIDVFSERIDPKYLFYKLTQPNITNYLHTVAENAVSAYPSIKPEDIGNLELSFPDLHTQQQISSFLSKIDEKIELNNKINSELEKLAKTIYSYWLLQFEFPNENGKPYKSSGGKMVWSDKLKKEIPEGWKSSSLASLIHESKNGDWGSDIVSNGRTKCFCVRGADIDGLNGIENFNPPIRYIDETHNNRLLKPDDLIIEISGGSPIQSTGRMAHISSDVLTRLGNKVVCSNFCKAVSLITPKLSYVISRYWAHLYDSKVFFNHEGKTSGIKNLLFDQLSKDVTIAIPTDENLINKYYKFEENIDQQKQNNLQQNEELTKLRDWLLPMLMNGQIKVDGEN